jgi:hypothetical protein
MEVQRDLRVKEMHIEVQQRLGYVGRTTFYEWRRSLGFRQPPYSYAHLEAIAAFGRYMLAGCDTQTALAKSREWLQQQGN